MKLGRIYFVYLILAASAAGITGCAFQKPVVKPGTEAPLPESPPVSQEKPGGEAIPKKDGVGEQLESLRQEAGPARPEIDYTVARQRVARRLSQNDEKLRHWQEVDSHMRELNLDDERPPRWDECLLALEDTVSSYSKENELLQEPAPTEVVSPPSLDSLWQEINFFESGCGLVYEKAVEALKKRQEGDPLQANARLESAVVHYAMQGRNADAVQAFRDMTAASPEFRPSAEVRYHYALALVRRGENTEAISFLRQNIEEAQDQGVFWPLQQLLADLLLVQGELAQAQEQYAQLAEYFDAIAKGKKWVDEQLALLAGDARQQSDSLTLFGDFLGKYILFDGRKVPPELKSAVLEIEEKFPGSPIAGRSRQILWLAEERAGSWVGRQLVLADRFVEQKDFSRAAEILDKLLAENLSDDVRKIVQDARDQIHPAEGAEEKTPDALQEETQATLWEKANTRLGLQQYDEAIAAFQKLLGSEYDEKAKTGIGEAVNAAAGEMRRKAAALFVKAKKTDDREKKRQLMVASLAILQQILTKYAEADIIEKVRLNIGVLEEQLRLADPDPAQLQVAPAGQE